MLRSCGCLTCCFLTVKGEKGDRGPPGNVPDRRVNV